MARAYYNEHDPFAAAWLRRLIAAGAIMDGEVDERDIQDVRPADLVGFTRGHFFAGVGGWDDALRLAGWPDDRPVWTGSCPCQPFSIAGSRKGTRDERHLWPEWFRLIRECRPAVIFGEQVAASIAHGWLDAVYTDLEAEGYACGAVVLPACSVGAPHLRQRLWFVAESNGERSVRLPAAGREAILPERLRAACLVADADGGEPCDRGLQRGRGYVQQPEDATAGLPVADRISAGLEIECVEPVRGECAAVERGGTTGLMGDTCGAGQPEQRGQGSARQSAWSDCIWIPCRDGKWRPIEPGLFPLAHGVPGRVGRLRAYGNAIVPQVAAEVIRAWMTRLLSS